MRRLFLILVSSSITLAQSQTAAPDFNKARDESIQILQGLIRIDTSNPPGNETRAATYLKAILDKEGIPAEIFALEPGRGNLVARIKGTGKARPILLMAHLDVVGVEREKWTLDPFAATIKDGYLYGRGVFDDKSNVAAALQVLLMLHRSKAPLDRDIIFLAEAGEEGTTSVGIDFMVKQHWDKIEAEFAINEGGWVLEENGKVRYVAVATTEKVANNTRLIARGSSGHGSMPRVDNPIVHLAAAIARIGEYQPPMRLNETTRTFFKRLTSISPLAEAMLYANVEDPVAGKVVEETFRNTNVMLNSTLRTSISPNIFNGGFRTNVIPGSAEATLDIRALPDEDMGEFYATLKRIVNDPAIEIVPPAPATLRPAAPPSRLDSVLFQSIEKAQAAVFPGAVTLPVMFTAATDSAQLRAKGVQAYGLGSVLNEEDRARMHGNDERLSVQGIGRFVELMYRAVVGVAVAK
ncbi:MAG TPA: M20/M25/M40 family metallo-hydrolase [Terriglobia bacterium]|nr:M20/M25/M40 family metallo-hydrolase [Terriglobia bacterium]